ncbi:hypothetical protein [Sediminitomix flava]|uniref:hypothetical protein n=1 Tax=Sediminitomix flava TaxID=379075 RepID=UPI0013048520|nr:hypothetical protein [Sediminitomix flava]
MNELDKKLGCKKVKELAALFEKKISLNEKENTLSFLEKNTGLSFLYELANDA